ncbi:uncharacterized protein MYCFIDRAFT_85567 [Pseudocercospora fijiensis CIRAD86]|uniref:Uncharacterized protein n=1 Tax=Pseudocercospora fijiensis (strain CIRAD86) TaxID=383855 RepID=M2ZI40_PSEFD|nr:uncharacterized protein MYCFIDRAFT_85567 [Pseudocercospora fijiensis CIRAD86]EME78759.1 hypothetical protein MYCFIDRAFT_85567 [Pseudocercospora fijiensis CIRAD86]
MLHKRRATLWLATDHCPEASEDDTDTSQPAQVAMTKPGAFSTKKQKSETASRIRTLTLLPDRLHPVHKRTNSSNRSSGSGDNDNSKSTTDKKHHKKPYWAQFRFRDMEALIVLDVLKVVCFPSKHLSQTGSADLHLIYNFKFKLRVLGSKHIDRGSGHRERITGYEEQAQRAKTVLTAQRVSKAFQSCILGFPKLLCQLGLKTHIGAHQATSVNALLAEPKRRIAPWFSTISIGGLDCFYVYNNHASLSVLFDISDAYKLQDTLKNNPSSLLSMWLQCPMPEHKAETKVKAQALGVLAGLAANLQEAAEALERARSQEVDYKIKVTDWQDPLDKRFDWRKGFTAEQLVMIVEGPRIIVS